jgi:hypothetical protein
VAITEPRVVLTDFAVARLAAGVVITELTPAGVRGAGGG